MNTRRHLLAFASACLVFGSWILAQQGWLACKARVAERLIDRAFEAHLVDGRPHRPWSWADMHPVARLTVPRLAIERTVLSGATGASLAFGPGHVDGTASPNTDGNCVLAGHRDGWFAFLRELRPGDELIVETRRGRRSYRVVATEVRSMWDERVVADTRRTQLTLVTCYPFDGLTGSDLRYVVVAVSGELAGELAEGSPQERVNAG